MTSPWISFPNAIHIGRLMESLNTNPDIWELVWKTVFDKTVSKKMFYNAWDDSWNEEVNIVREDVRPVCIDINAWSTAEAAICALVAYDDCGYMLDSDPGELRILAAFGDHRAVLLLPACTALSKEKDLV